MYALGFANKKIEQILFLESGTIALAGSVTGIFVGYLFNLISIKALNSIWVGAVQTNTLTASINIKTMLTGLLSSVFISLLFLKIKSKFHLRKLERIKTGADKKSIFKNIFWLFILSLFFTITLLSLAILKPSIELSIISQIAFTGWMGL